MFHKGREKRVKCLRAAPDPLSVIATRCTSSMSIASHVKENGERHVRVPTPPSMTPKLLQVKYWTKYSHPYSLDRVGTAACIGGQGSRSKGMPRSAPGIGTCNQTFYRPSHPHNTLQRDVYSSTHRQRASKARTVSSCDRELRLI